jgi:fatty acid desaturase
MSEYISEKEINSQVWKFYFIMFAWPVYLFVLPYVFSKIGWWSVLFMIFPGVYLFTWLGYLMHETWHKYVPTINNEKLYCVLSWMLLTDPQIYKILHGFHHSQVNTWEDNEFHPLGDIKNRTLKVIYNAAEIFLGIAFISLAASFILPRHPKYRSKYKKTTSITAVVIIALYLGVVGAASHYLLGAGIKAIIISFLVSIWINSFFLHHSQMIEHGNLIVEGDYNKRNVMTRNLNDKGFVERIFLFFTHGDTQEHVLHHTLVGVYSRPFPGKVPMPENAVYITIKDYMRILGQMLLGRTEVVK